MEKFLLAILIGVSINTVAYSQTTFSAKQPINIATGDAPFVIDSGNLDADAFADIVIGTNLGDTVEWYKNNGDGTFTMQPLIANDIIECGGVTIADLNNDGFNDILASNFGDDELVWFENDGFGNFATEQIISTGIDGSSGIVTGFIDAGTTIDVAVVGFNSGDTVWFSNDGFGTFSGPNTIESIPGSGPGNLDLADFDGDGDNDIVLMNSGIGTVELYYNNLIPSGTVSFTKDVNTVTSGEVYPFDASFGDVDDDTNLDIVVVDLYGGTSGLGWYKKEIDGTFSETILTTTITAPATAMVEDMDNDGYNDIVLSSGANGAGTDIVWFRSTASGTFGSEIIIDNTQSQTYAFTLNDLDNDGDIDITNIAYNDDDLNWFENELITLSLNDQTEESISFYPNPTSSKLNFKGLFSDATEVSVFDILGKEIVSTKIDSSSSLDVSNLENGTYILKFKNYDTIIKFVKE
ncbi:T9SS type A sorting domain-containing protein [Psychroserpens ponticola]|uniref:T9SS type A sorting domain-containing protein n=1 Tax=Psychroserpens ponticola TaxID=2932268 RepID=A0ABY7S2G9_9FLAO|nr:T9SS type A sorting domain-containing protein [Psychroserpens ponticola]WCO03313.1 T9SS type A sorting domain-containing protein [Psychroserpens ponticola]